MPHLTPEAQFDELKRKIAETLGDVFPVKGERSELVLHGVEVKDDKSSGDIRSQKEALRDGRTWDVPVYGDVSLMRSGQEVARRKVLLLRLPKTTDRFGYIVDGNEYQSPTQFRQKSGVYHRKAPGGHLLADFNLANRDQFARGRSFKVQFNPEEAVFYLEHGSAQVPIYHLLQAAGVSEKEMERAWGADITAKNRDRNTRDSVLRRFYKTATGEALQGDIEEAGKLFTDLLSKTQLRPDTTEKTLGKGYSSASPDAILRSTGVLLDMSRGLREDDDRHSLEFQSVHSIDDFLDGRIKREAWKIKRKMMNNLEKTRSIRRIVPVDAFNKAIRGYFSSDLANQPEQTNPLEMVSGQLHTTIMGEQGGIKSPHAVFEDAKLIHPSHIGFLDPIQTPEGDKTGVSLTLSLGVKKNGNELEASFLNVRTGRRDKLRPEQAAKATVAFPDQFVQQGKRRVPVAKKVKAMRNGDLVEVSPSEVDYIIPTPRGMLGMASNLVPFLQNNQGNRAMTAVRQAEQAVPLRYREAPLVQVDSDSKVPFEDVMGFYASASSPADGEVEEVRKDSVIVRSGKTRHEVQFYRDFPLKGSSLYDSEVVVKAGDRVKKGQLLADSTFTRQGTLALGTNLRTAYMPFHGLNFEDGVVISEEAAKKLTSMHMYKKGVGQDADTVVNRRKFLATYPTSFTKGQLDGVGEDGVVQIGQRVKPGDPLITILRKPAPSKLQQQLRTFRRGQPDRFKDSSLLWDKPYEGTVTDIVRRGREITVFVKTEEPAQIGDKIVGRHGNKGVITRILPAGELPYQEDDKGNRIPVDLVLNPLGVPGRINLGQVLETAAGKIAEKKGSPYKVRNFEPGKDYLDGIRKDLASAGLEDKDVLIDPETGKAFPQRVLTGQQYIYKLKHQVGKKLTGRSGGPGVPYDINHVPSSGSPSGGQSMGELGNYVMLAHGARENLHEMLTYKSSRDNDVWDSIREGRSLPPPKSPFAYEKFLGYLNALRVNVKKEGNQLILMPFTEQQVKDLSNGKLSEPGLVVRGKDLKPEAGGLFDEKITGGREGTKWSHFALQEPMPNPLFEDAIKKLTGLTGKQYDSLLGGETEVDGKRGGAAIEALLKKVNVQKELAATRERALKQRGDARDATHKKLRILMALDSQKVDPTVYMMRSVPVVPPVMRPVTAKEDGSLSTNDLNFLYKDVAAVNEALENGKKAGLPDSYLAPIRMELYDGLCALAGTKGSLVREYRGILDVISGDSPKEGYFQETMLKRRQDFSGRSTIIPEPRMGLDEVGIPEKMAWSMYSPFVLRELTRGGMRMLDAKAEMKSHSAAAERALQKVVGERPVLLKRDPALHAFNVLAFKPRVVRGNAIEIHPLVVSGYNADFDGDCVDGQVLVDTSRVAGYAVGEGADMPHLTSFSCLSVIEIRDFPRIEASVRVTDKGVIKYAVPEGVCVPAFHPEGTRMLPVTEFSIHPNCEEWVATSMNGRETSCSSDHSLVALDPETLEVRKYPPRDVVGRCFPVMSGVTGGSIESLPGVEARHGGNEMLPGVLLTFDVGWFIGATTGDGWAARERDRYKGVCLSYGEDDTAVADKWESVASSLTAGAVSRTKLPHEFDGGFYTSVRSTVSSCALGTWMGDLIGHGARNKHLPSGCLDWVLDARRGLFCGLIDTDGSANWNKNDRFSLSFSSTSLRLANDIRLLGLSLGLPCSFTEFENRDKPAYILTFSVRPVQDAPWLRIFCTRKQGALTRLREESEKEYGRNDVVPLTDSVRGRLLTLCREGGASRRPPNRDAGLFSLYVVLNRGLPYLTRTSYRNVCTRFGEDHELAAWFRVCDMPVLWDVYEKAEPTGETKVMYDITVPGSWTFATADGSFVWDTMSAYVPLGPKAVQEATKLFPSNNLFHHGTGAIMHTPGHEALLGLFLASKPGKKTGKKFVSLAEARKAHKTGTLEMTDIVHVGGAETTLGRMEIESVLPAAMRETGKKPVAEMMILDKKATGKLLSDVARNHSGSYDEVANKFKDVGNDYSSALGFSVGLDDFAPVDREFRDRAVRMVKKKVETIRASSLPRREQDKKVVDLLQRLDDKVFERVMKKLDDHPSNIYQMMRSGSRGNPQQLKQIVSAPMLVLDAKNNVVPHPIARSYSEGLDVAGYMTAMHGARKGTVAKVQEVREPGYISKQIINTTMDMLVTEDDCGSNRGVNLSTDERDIVDRYLAHDVNIGGHKVRGGTLVTPRLLAEAKKDHKSVLAVRSPLRCRASHGVCKRCMGLNVSGHNHDVGDNVGVLAAQSIGEPSAQLSMNLFHCHHRETLLRLRLHGDEITLSMREAFDRLDGIVEVYDDCDEKHLTDVEVRDKGCWTDLEKIGRHRLADHRMLVLRSVSGHVQLLQDNHPVMVREVQVTCPECGNSDSQQFLLLGHRTDKYYLECTCGRRFQCSREDYKRATPRLRFAGDVKKGDFVDIEVVPTCSDIEWVGIPAYVVGTLVAEGNVYRVRSAYPEMDGQKSHYQTSLHGRKLHALRITQKEGPVRSHIKKLLDDAHVLYKEPSPSTIHMVGRDKALWGMKEVGSYSADKHLPYNFHRFGRQWSLEALAGVLDGDGQACTPVPGQGRPYLAIDTTSVALVQQVAVLLSGLQVEFSVFLSTVRDLTRHQGYQIRFWPHAAVRAELDLLTVKKLPEGCSRPATRHSDVLVECVDYIREVFYGADEWVYDVTSTSGTFMAGSMWTHNSGGVAKGRGAGAKASFERLSQLLRLPKDVPDTAPLAVSGGKVEKIVKPPQGGFEVWIGGKRHYSPAGQDLRVKVGDKVEKGQQLSDGTINPVHLLHLKGVQAAQDHLADSLQGVLGDVAPVKRRNVEVVVKSMTNVTKVDDPGDHPEWAPGDVQSQSAAEAWNRTHPGRRKVEHTPYLKGIDVLPREMREDWLARLNFNHLSDTIIEAAREGRKSDIHGLHPVPGMSFATEFGKGKEKLGPKWKGEY